MNFTSPSQSTPAGRRNHSTTVSPSIQEIRTNQNQTNLNDQQDDRSLDFGEETNLLHHDSEGTQRAQVLTNIPSNHLNKNFQPGSVHDVFKYNFTLAEGEYKNCEIVARNSVRKNVYPIIKFLWYDSPHEKEKNFNYIKEDLLQHGKEKELRKENPCAYEFLRGLNKLDEDTPAIDKAIFWNTYRKLVENTLSNQRSSDISLMKRNIVPGNENTSFFID